jgi:ATP-dependent exoDNAse (exonuclease V) beta subunit
MLDPIKELLKNEGIPFANRYRRRRKDWNPLYDAGHGIHAVELITSFFGHGTDDNYWNVSQFLNWAKFIKVGDDGLKKKVGKKYIKRLELAVENNEDGLDSIRNTLDKIMNPNAIHHALNHNIEWLEDNILKARQPGLIYPIKVLKKNGVSIFEEEPEIIIGTIHSVKGAEADCVFLFPDFSIKADEQFQFSKEAKDSMFRVFYVGMTRAREELVICGKSVIIPQSIIPEEKMFINL